MVTTNSKYLFKMVLFNLRLSEQCSLYEFIVLNMYFFIFCYFFFKQTFFYIYRYIRVRRIRVHRIAQENLHQQYHPLIPPPRVYPSLANYNDNNNTENINDKNNSIEVKNIMDMDDKIFEEMTNYLTSRL